VRFGAFLQEDVEQMCSWHDHLPAIIPATGRHELFDVEKHREYVAKPEACTKLAALRADLLSLRAKDASMHAVVFTHIMATHLAVVSMLRAAHFHVCEFSGSTQVDKRHEAIRECARPACNNRTRSDALNEPLT
jgi:hypothetical protein